MFANHPITRPKFSVALATLSLVALALSGCGWAQNYAKPIRVKQVKHAHQSSVNLVIASFFTAEEKKVAFEQLERIQSAYLEMIETKPGKDGSWTYSAQVVTGDRLLLIAQVRALRDEYLPPSGLSNEEKKQGVKTCDEAICALVANKLPLDLSRTPPNRKLLQLAMDQIMGRLRVAASAAEGEIEVAAPTPPAEREVKPKPHGKVDGDKEVRQALALLQDALAYAKEEATFVIPEGPCQINLAVEIQEGVDDFLKKLGAN